MCLVCNVRSCITKKKPQKTFSSLSSIPATTSPTLDGPSQNSQTHLGCSGVTCTWVGVFAQFNPTVSSPPPPWLTDTCEGWVCMPLASGCQWEVLSVWGRLPHRLIPCPKASGGGGGEAASSWDFTLLLSVWLQMLRLPTGCFLVRAARGYDRWWKKYESHSS